jgi:hypothetical protein
MEVDHAMALVEARENACLTALGLRLLPWSPHGFWTECPELSSRASCPESYMMMK